MSADACADAELVDDKRENSADASADAELVEDCSEYHGIVSADASADVRRCYCGRGTDWL